MLSTLSSTAWPLPTFCTSSTSRMMLPPSLIWLRVLIRLVVMTGSDQVIGGAGGARGVGGGDLGLAGLPGLGGAVALGQCVLLEAAGGGGEHRGEQQCGSKSLACHGGIPLSEWALHPVLLRGVVLADATAGLD